MIDWICDACFSVLIVYIAYTFVILIPGLDTAECFEVRTGEWRMIASMSTRRSSVGVGVVSGKNFR